jgi:translocation and assembly module TamB
VLFVVGALLAAIDLGLGTATVRRMVVRQVNAATRGAFKGRLVIDGLSTLHLTGVSGVDAHVEGPDGTVVVRAIGTSARVAPLGLLLSLVRHGDLRIDVFDVQMDSVEVDLAAGPDGAPLIASTFDPSASAPVDTKPGRPIRLTIASIGVRRATVHHAVPNVPGADADLVDMHASVRVAPDGVAVDVTHAEVAARGMPNGADPHGSVVAHLAVPAKSGSSFGLTAGFRGDVGGVPARADCTLDGDSIDAAADVPAAAPEAMRALVEAWPVRRAVAVRAEAHGPWSAVQVKAAATVGDARVDAAGEVSLQGPFAATVTADARGIDVGAFEQGTTRSDLGFHATAVANVAPGGHLAGHFAVQTRPGKLDGQAVPPAVITGDVDEPGGRGLRIVARGHVDEPGAPIALEGKLDTAASPPRISFEVTSQVRRLDAVARLGGRVAGAADVHVAGAVTLDRTPGLTLAVEAVADDVTAGGATLEHAHVAGSVAGAVANPTLTVSVDARGIVLGRYRFGQGHLDTRGSLLRQMVHVDLVGDLHARGNAKVALGSAVSIDEASVALSRGSTALRAEADHVQIDGGRVDVEGALVEGVGDATRATVHLRPGSLVAQADSAGLDLKALGYVLGLDRSLRDGRAAFAIDVRATREGAEGSATIDVANGCFLAVDGLTGHLDARMMGRELTGAFEGAATGLGSLKVSGMHVQVGGRGPLDVRAWRRVWGALGIEGDVDLGRIAALLPPNALPVAEVAGRVRLRGHIARDRESDLVPDVTLSLQTSGLRVGARGGPDRRSDGTVLVAPPPWTLSGIDVTMDGSVVGGGLTEVALRLGDAQGAIVVVDAKSEKVPYERMLGAGAGLADALARVPFRAQVSIPERSLESLPDVLRPQGVTGTGEATVRIDGSCLAPSIDLRGSARSVHWLDSGRRDPIDASFSAKYDGHTVDGEAELRSRAETLLRAVAQAHAEAASIVAGAPAWNASMQASLTHLPLSSIPVLSDRGLRGSVSGKVELTGLHEDARATADLDLADLRVGKTAYGSANVRAAYDGKAVQASARLDEGDGSGEVAAKVGVAWGDRVVPAFDAALPAEASLKASRLRIGVLGPFVQGVIEELEGRLDADARIALAPGRAATLTGSAALSDGQVAVGPLGQELRAVHGKVHFDPDGVVRLTDFSADGTSGKVEAHGEAHLEGTRFVGATAEVTVAKKDAMPLAVEGTEVGTVYGKIDLRATASADHRTVNLRVDVPSWHVELPEASSHGVQDLGAPPAEVHVGVYAGHGRFVQLAVDGAEAPGADAGLSGDTASPLVTEVHLGSDVEVRRGTDVKVDVDGDVTAKMARHTTVTGQVRLKAGTLDVQGKTFDIQSGTVTFVGDPANPVVRVTASWVALDGTRVFADYLGPLKTGKVTLRSEPPRPRNEILALVMFGSADGSASTPYSTPQPDAATKAGTTVGAFASGGLSKGLDKLTGMDITAKIDASQANPRPEVEVQIAKDISLQLAFVLGTPPPGTNPDTTYATIDWRFLHDWSLETTFGNLGSSIADIVWQRRY